MHELETLKEDNRALRVKLKAAVFKKKSIAIELEALQIKLKILMTIIKRSKIISHKTSSDFSKKKRNLYIRITI